MAWPHGYMIRTGIAEGLTEAEAVKLARDIINAETDSEKEERRAVTEDLTAAEKRLYAAAGMEYRQHSIDNTLREAAGLLERRKSYEDETASQRATRQGRERAEQDPEYKRLREIAGLR